MLSCKHYFIRVDITQPHSLYLLYLPSAREWGGFLQGRNHGCPTQRALRARTKCPCCPGGMKTYWSFASFFSYLLNLLGWFCVVITYYLNNYDAIYYQSASLLRRLALQLLNTVLWSWLLFYNAYVDRILISMIIA